MIKTLNETEYAEVLKEDEESLSALQKLIDSQNQVCLMCKTPLKKSVAKTKTLLKIILTHFCTGANGNCKITKTYKMRKEKLAKCA